MDDWPKTLTKNQRRRLARYECGWCGQRCNRGACGAIRDQCDEETRRKRAADCLNAARSPALRDHNLYGPPMANDDLYELSGSGDLALDAQLEAWECEGVAAWFKERCAQPGNKDLCPAAGHEWYLDAEGRTRCKLCDLPMN